jgi:hypothetical protein
MTTRIRLEPEAQVFAEAMATPPFLFTLGPERGRIALDEAQSGRVRKLPVDVEDLIIDDGPSEQSLFASYAHSTRRLRSPSLCTSTVPGGCSATRRRMTG